MLCTLLWNCWQQQLVCVGGPALSVHMGNLRGSFSSLKKLMYEWSIHLYLLNCNEIHWDQDLLQQASLPQWGGGGWCWTVAAVLREQGSSSMLEEVREERTGHAAPGRAGNSAELLTTASKENTLPHGKIRTTCAQKNRETAIMEWLCFLSGDWLCLWELALFNPWDRQGLVREMNESDEFRLKESSSGIDTLLTLK